MFIEDVKTDFYQRLVGNRVVLLVNHDVDALCATRVLLYLLETDNIQYSLISVRTMDDFVNAFNGHCSRVNHVILINLGATFDVFDVVECDDDKSIFIIDNHRPVDPCNVYRSQIKLVMNPDSCRDIPAYEDLFRDSDEEEEGEGARLSLQQLEKRRERRLWRERRLRLLFEYSQFSYFGESVALSLFNLAWKLSKDNPELLWLAIVGVSDVRLNEKIDEKVYEEMVASLKNHLTRLNHTQSHQSVRNAIDISYTKDLQLTLYRHWTLFESLRHTRYTSCKFKVWNVKGFKKMLEFLAEVGIPLIQCKQKFLAMDLEFRKHVQEWVEELSEKYGLQNVVEESFIATRGYRHKYNSNDVALGVKAILESSNKESTLSEKFLEALDALSSKKVDVLQNGIELAKTQLIAVLKQVHATIEMKSVTSGGPFLYAVIQESAPDAKLFAYPGCLLTLAKYLLHSHVAASRSRRVVNLPLVVIAPDVHRPDTALAVGIPPVAEQSTNNLFGKALTQAGQSLKCTVETDFYDSCVVRFPSELKSQLIDTLVALLS